MAAAAGGDQLEDCLRLIEAQMLALSDRPYAPTARPTQTLLLVSTLLEVLDSSGRHTQMTGTARAGAGSPSPDLECAAGYFRSLYAAQVCMSTSLT